MNGIVQHDNFTVTPQKKVSTQEKTLKISLLIHTSNIENKYT